MLFQTSNTSVELAIYDLIHYYNHDFIDNLDDYSEPIMLFLFKLPVPEQLNNLKEFIMLSRFLPYSLPTSALIALAASDREYLHILFANCIN